MNKIQINIIKSIKPWFLNNNHALSRQDIAYKYFGLLVAIAITPFAALEFSQQNYPVFLVECVAILLLLLDVILTQLCRGSIYLRFMNLSGLGAIILFLLSIRGATGVYWAFPYIVLLHFVLPPRKAVIINAAFLLCMTVLIFDVINEAESYRILVTLSLSSLAAFIYSFVVERQQLILKSSEQRFRNLYDSNPAMYFTTDKSGIVLSINQHGVERLGYEKVQIVGKPAVNIFHDEDKFQAHEYLMRSFAEPDKVHTSDLKISHRDGTSIGVHISIRVINHLFGEPTALLVCEDISDLKQVEKSLRLRNNLSEMLHNIAVSANTSKTPEEVIRTTLKTICIYMRWQVGHCYLVDPENKDRLVSSGLWYFEKENYSPSFRKITEEISFASGEGLAGCILLSKTPVCVCTTDIQKDERFISGNKFGIQTGVGLPILSGDQVKGVLEFFINDQNEPDQSLLNVLLQIGTEIGRVFERYEAEKALTKSKELYRNLIETTSAIAWELDIASRKFTYISPQVEDITGFPAEKWTDFSFWAERIYPDDREHAVEYCMANTARGLDHSFDYRLNTAENKTIWLRDIASVITNQGEPSILRGYFIDITERKLADEARKNSEEKFRSAFNSSPNSMCITRISDGQIIDANESFCKSLGFILEEVVGKTTPELGIWNDPEQRSQYLNVIKQQGYHEGTEVSFKNMDGRKIDSLLSGSLVEINGELCVFSNSYDITERKQVQKALNNTNRSLKVIDQCNQILLHATDEQLLLDEICKIIVDTGESRMAGVGLVEHDKNKSVRMVAHHGYEHDYLANANVNWREDDERGQGPVGIAIRSGRPFITRDMKTDQTFAPWREAALMRGYASNVVLPLMTSGRTLGVLLIYSSIPDSVDDDELNLLINLSNNMAYGMMALRTNQEHKQSETKLRESEERFRTTYRDASIGMALISLDHRYIDGNPSFCDMLGYSKEELVGKFLKEITHPDDAQLGLEYHNNLIDGEIDNYHIEKRYIHKEGFDIWASLSVSLVQDNNNAPLYAIAQIQDITERKQADMELQKLSHAVESSSSSVIITDAEGNIEYVNSRFSEITGYAKEEVLGQIPRFLLQSGETTESVYDDISISMKSKGKWKGEFRSQKKDSSLFWDRASISCVKNANGEITHYIGIQDDVTLEYELAEKLNYQACHDALTGLINRREFERRAGRLLTMIKQDKDKDEDEDEHAMCFMDLDQFKIVNDTCGHAAGDELLRQLARVLQKTVRHRDTLARMGGDEFGVLMEYCSLDHAHRVASSLQKAVQDFHFVWQGQSFRVGISIGLIAITESTPDLTELLKGADAACYMAKDLGRNRIHVYQSNEEKLIKRSGETQWAARIHQAINEERFCLYVQSIMPLDNTADKHYEILLRLVDEKGRLNLPQAFFPAAGRYNLLPQLDHWVIQKAFSLLAEHPAFLKQIGFISINLSGQSLANEDFLGFVIEQIEINKIPPDNICFEITETEVISNLSIAIEFISRLREIGCRFALDDFGSGLSSFGYLKNLPVDYLKIDGMFVKDIVDDPIDRAMVKSINEIGQVMGMQTIAEFVENNEVKGMLREIGVNYAQGLGIGKPMSFDELLSRTTNVTYINS